MITTTIDKITKITKPGQPGQGKAPNVKTRQIKAPEKTQVVERRTPTAGPGEVIAPSQGDAIMKRNGLNPGSRKMTDKDWVRAAGEAAREAQRKLGPRTRTAGAGGNGEIYQRIIDMTTPKVDWRKELADIIGEVASSYQYKPWNRRAVGRGEYRYSVKQEVSNLDNIVVALDVSGSVANAFPELAAEVVGIAMARECQTLSVLPFASSVVDPFQMHNGEIPTADDFVKVRTGGGSEAIPLVNKWIEDNLEGDIDVYVIVTDGYLTYGPGPEPECADAVIWLIFDNPTFTSPWGRIIHATGDKGYWN